MKALVLFLLVIILDQARGQWTFTRVGKDRSVHSLNSTMPTKEGTGIRLYRLLGGVGSTDAPNRITSRQSTLWNL